MAPAACHRDAVVQPLAPVYPCRSPQHNPHPWRRPVRAPLPRLRHVEDGAGAFVPPNGLTPHGDGSGVAHAMCEIEVPGHSGTLQACFTLPVSACMRASLASAEGDGRLHPWIELLHVRWPPASGANPGSWGRAWSHPGSWHRQRAAGLHRAPRARRQVGAWRAGPLQRGHRPSRRPPSPTSPLRPAPPPACRAPTDTRLAARGAALLSSYTAKLSGSGLDAGHGRAAGPRGRGAFRLAGVPGYRNSSHARKSRRACAFAPTAALSWGPQCRVRGGAARRRCSGGRARRGASGMHSRGVSPLVPQPRPASPQPVHPGSPCACARAAHPPTPGEQALSWCATPARPPQRSGGSASSKRPWTPPPRRRLRA
jgi:hypothetical protein